jgi:hypothetical protein
MPVAADEGHLVLRNAAVVAGGDSGMNDDLFLQSIDPPDDLHHHISLLQTFLAHSHQMFSADYFASER